MSAFKKIAYTTLIYAVYQLLTNEKYKSFKDEILKEYESSHLTDEEILDKAYTHLSVPKDIGDEAARMTIDEEIRLIKRKIKQLDAKRIAKNSNEWIVNNINKASPKVKSKHK